MTKHQLSNISSATLLLMALAMPMAAQETGDEKKTAETAEASSIVTRIVYQPKDVGAPAVTVSGGVRGEEQAPTVSVLSPLTIVPVFTPQPTLYWFMTAKTPTPVRVTLVDEGSLSAKPFLEVQLGPIDRPGIYAFSLAEQGGSLDTGKRYAWSVALETPANSYSEQPVASTIFERIDQPPAFADDDGLPPLERSRQLAAAGYWYEAFDALSQPIEQRDASQDWIEIRANLLEQVGLTEVAAFERERIAQ